MSTPEAAIAVPPADVTVIEAPTARKALEEVNARFGSRADILGASKVLRGGLGGFFAKEMIQLRVRTSSTGERPGARRADGPSSAAGPLTLRGAAGHSDAVGERGAAGARAGSGHRGTVAEGAGGGRQGAAIEREVPVRRGAAEGPETAGAEGADAVAIAQDGLTSDRTPAVTRLLSALTGSVGDRERTFAEALRSHLARDTAASDGLAAGPAVSGDASPLDGSAPPDGETAPASDAFPDGAAVPGSAGAAVGGVSLGGAAVPGSAGAAVGGVSLGGAAVPGSVPAHQPAGSPAATGPASAPVQGARVLAAPSSSPGATSAPAPGGADGSAPPHGLIAGHAEGPLRATARAHLAAADLGMRDGQAVQEASAAAYPAVRQPLAPDPLQSTAAAPHLEAPAVPFAPPPAEPTPAAAAALAARAATVSSHSLAGLAPPRPAAQHAVPPTGTGPWDTGTAQACAEPQALDPAVAVQAPADPQTADPAVAVQAPADPQTADAAMAVLTPPQAEGAVAAGSPAQLRSAAPPGPTGRAPVDPWRGQALERLGLPRLVLDALAGAADDIARLQAIAAAVASLCRPLPAGVAMLVGPQAGTLSPALRVPLVLPPGPAPAAGPVAAAVGAGHRDWIAAQRGSRWLHLVAGGPAWEQLSEDGALAVSWATAADLPAALRVAADRGLVLGYDGWRGARRADPLDVAVAVRELVVAR